MEPSPKVPTPRAGDAMTAEWAALVADAANAVPLSQSRPGSVSTPYGSAEPPSVVPMLGAFAMPLPFDCRIVRNAGESADTLYIWLPNNGADLVLWGGAPLPPAAGQSTGTASTGWVSVGTVTNGSARYVYLALHLGANGVPDGWKIEDTGTAWDGSFPPKVAVAVYNIAADQDPPPAPGTDNGIASGKIGLVQCHRGVVALDPPQRPEALDTDETPGDPPGESIDRWQSSSTPGEQDQFAPLQLRNFADTTDTLDMQGTGDTGGLPTPANVDIVVRKTGVGTGDVRPRVEYVPANDGPFWVRGGDGQTNYGTEIKLGQNNSYITISAS